MAESLLSVANWLRGQSRDALGPEARALLAEAADRVEGCDTSLLAEVERRRSESAPRAPSPAARIAPDDTHTNRSTNPQHKE